MEDAETRREALRLYLIYQEADKAHEAAGGAYPDVPEEASRRIREISNTYHDTANQLREKYEADVDAVEAQYRAPSPLREVRDAASAAYEASPGPGLLTDYDDDPVLCAKTGLPIWATDEIVEDPETGETFLRAALGLPARAIDADEIEEAA